MAEHQSVAHMFLDRVKKSGPKTAFQFPKGDSWGTLSWTETAERVRHIAMGLKKLGLRLEDRCAILCTTRIEWVLCDLGILCAGGATTTVYPSNTPDECAYILNDSGARFIFAEDKDQVGKLEAVRAQLRIEKVILLDGQSSNRDWVMTLADLEAAGKAYDAQEPQLFQRTVDEIQPQHLATLIYTSGTTGQPKGVELVHDCWVFTGKGIEGIGSLVEADHQYLWLPLSHSFGKVLEAAQLQIGFCTTIDGRIPKLVENLGVVRPTFMAAAPRIFEKVYNKVVTGAQQGGALKWAIFQWAVSVGRQVSALRQKRRQPSGLLALKFKLADKLVFSKLKQRFGGRIKFFISGSAPLSREMAEFFHAADILILEGYGLTESSAASFVNRPSSFEFGSVGLPLDGVKVRIEPSDGEILIGGRGIMRGYYNKPQETKEALTDDGWLRTGDIGEMSANGNLKITDRKKDLIKTSGGKYVAPQALEGSLKALCPYISQVLVHGNNRNFCSALVTLDPEAIVAWKQEHGLNGIGPEQLAKHPEVTAMIQAAVDQLNKTLPSYETIKRFAVLPEDLTVENGALTASLKVKRKTVEQKYRAVLDEFYTGAIESI